MRRRVFVVGARQGVAPAATPSPHTRLVTVSEALDDLPSLSRYSTLYKENALLLNRPQVDAMHAKQSAYVLELNGSQTADRNFAERRVWDPAHLLNVGLTRHSSEVIARFRRLRPGERDRVGRLPKLQAGRQSPTLRAGTGRDHGSFTSARPVHHRIPRVITVREAARLHGFPDWFGFHVTKWQGFRQVGNAVPPPLARAVAHEIVVASNLPVGARRRTIALGADSLLSMSLTEAAQRFDLHASKLPVNVRRLKQP